jgi:hypothetical protein
MMSVDRGGPDARLKAARTVFDPRRTSSWLWPALASALVANDWTVELTGLITSRGKRKLAPAGARSGAALGPRWPHNFDSRQLAFFTILHL